MAHRASQVVDAIEALLVASSALGAGVYKFRTLSLSELEQELPAVCINIGEDLPLTEFSAVNLSYTDSLLAVTCSAYAEADTEAQVMQTLFEMRRNIHVALMADRSLALAFVIDCRYQGALAPETNTGGLRIAGRLDNQFAVHYRMNSTDPS